MKFILSSTAPTRGKEWPRHCSRGKFERANRLSFPLHFRIPSIRSTIHALTFSFAQSTFLLTFAKPIALPSLSFLVSYLSLSLSLARSLSLSLAHSITFNLNPNRKSNAIFTIVSPFSQPLLCFSFFFFFSKFEILFLPPPFSFEFFSFRMYLVFFFSFSFSFYCSRFFIWIFWKRYRYPPLCLNCRSRDSRPRRARLRGLPPATTLPTQQQQRPLHESNS